MYFFLRWKCLSVFRPPLGSVACRPFAVVSLLKAAFVPSLWLRSDHATFSTACFTQCHMLHGWPHRFFLLKQGNSPRQRSVNAAALWDWPFLAACSINFQNTFTLYDGYVTLVWPLGRVKRSQDTFSQVHGSSSPTAELANRLKGILLL